MRLGRLAWVSRVAGWIAAGTMGLAPAMGRAADPRWTAGRPYFVSANGQPVLWSGSPQYYTDPGDLSAAVNHAAADQMVAAAAAIWNVPVSRIVLGQGGTLDEHVSGNNMYLGPQGPVFPADVQASNGVAKPIAVIYDADGSVTDTLLGGGASDPGNCRQNAVTESVDGISVAAQITHALIVLNGRCTGSAPEMQLEMQYKLGRVFGRVLGFGWSQANDNVWTGSPVATYRQALHWPLMHPVDVYCGRYAYQCVVEPFTLKTDDLASIASLYPVTTAGNGKTATFAEATYIIGLVRFGDGHGMQGVNVVSRTRHQANNATDLWDGTSSVTGYQFQRVGGNPVTPKGSSLGESFGSPTAYPGDYRLGWIPTPLADRSDDVTVYTQAINPLYTGQYAVGPYQGAQVIPSGPALSAEIGYIGAFNWGNLAMTATQGAGPCSTPLDGTERAPAAVDATGWWASTMCGYGHTAWSSLAVRAGRTLAMEVTSLDDSGLPTTGKLQPVMGLWDSRDAVGVAPTQGAQTDSLNTTTLGMTSLLYASGSTGRTLRIGLGDGRGDGRADFVYKARVLYADAVSPATVPPNGGRITISGMGFRNGNAVTVNGVAATVVSWSASAIVAVAPGLSGMGAMDVTVTDLSTGSQTTMTGALTYGGAAQADTVAVVSSPASGGYVGAAGAPDFKVQVTLPDGSSPGIGVSVTVSAVNATLGGCAGASSCVLTSDGNGQVTTTVTPTVAGTVTLTASVGQASATATFVTGSLAADVLRVTSVPVGTVYAGVAAAMPFGVQVMLADGVTPAAGVAVVVSAVNATLAACGAASCAMTTDANGMISTGVTPVAAGQVSLVATAGGGRVSASFGAIGLPADELRVVSVPANGSYVGRVAGTAFSVRAMLGDGVTPAAGAAVVLTGVGATLVACGAASCTVAADGAGMVSTTVTPTVAGVVSLSGTAGGGSVSVTFTTMAAPLDGVRAVSVPADESYVGRVAAVPFAVQVTLGGTGAAGAGTNVTLTTSNGTLGACGSAACVVTADAHGMVSTTVTPSFVGLVTLTGAEGGGMVTATFMAGPVPADVLRVMSVPADGSAPGRAAATPFGVQVLRGDTGAPAVGVTVTVRASNGTSGCIFSTCPYTSDGNGMIAATVTPTNPGVVDLTATEGGGLATASFNAVAAVADVLRVVSAPAEGSSVGQAAATMWVVQVTRTGTGVPVTGAVVVVTAVNATMGYCGNWTTCWLTTDGSGTVRTPVTPTGPGRVLLTATQGGGEVTTTFNAAAAPVDRLRVTSQPTGKVYAGLLTGSPFSVQVMLPDGVTPAAGASVTVGAVNARLAGCAGAATCVLTADAGGNVSSGVTPVGAGLVTLTAAAGGGTTAASFNAVVLPADGLRVVSAPADGAVVGLAAGSPFQVQTMLGDGVTPAAGVAVTLSSAGVSFGSCPGAPCVLTADGRGMVSTSVTPTVLGSVTLTAAAGGGTVSATFRTAVQGPDGLRVVSAPADGSYVGQVAGSVFQVKVMLGDGLTPAAGAAVTLSAVGASLGACRGGGCAVTADAAGMVTTEVTPVAAGVARLTASAGGGTVSVGFTAVARRDVLRVLSAPAGPAYVGYPAGTPLVVQVMLPDGVTPAAGAAVTLTGTGASLAACGGVGCGLTADVLGRVSTEVTATAAGTVTITAAAGGGSVTATFTAVDAVHGVTLARVVEYVAPGAVVAWTPMATVFENGAAAAGLTVSWTGDTAGGIGFPVGSTNTDGQGETANGSVIGPLASGATATGAVCAWTTVCAPVSAAAVDPARWRLVVVSGGGQDVALGDALAPVGVRVVDDAGHWIAGASVALRQVADGWVDCPGAGRCPIAPVLGEASETLVSDVDGMVSGVPLEVGGVRETTRMVFAAGPNGYVALTLAKSH